MKLALFCCTLVLLALAVPSRAAEGPLDFTMNSLDGKPVDLSKYKGEVVLIVNVASQCGFTPQYAGLEALYRRHQDKGFVVLGFPCNQFGRQEPGDGDAIVSFCSRTYDVTFPLFAKVEVNGPGAAPLYQFLTAAPTKPQAKGPIGWNFEKFVVGRGGQVVARFAPNVEPDAAEVLAVIERELAAKSRSLRSVS